MGKSIVDLTADAMRLIHQRNQPVPAINAIEEVTVGYSAKVRRAVRRAVMERMKEDSDA